MRLLPDNILWYADDVTLRPWKQEQYQDYLQSNSTDFSAESVKKCEVGLLGWCAIGGAPTVRLVRVGNLF